MKQFMYKSFKTEFAGRPLEIETGKFAELAGGAVMVRYGDLRFVYRNYVGKAERGN